MIGPETIEIFFTNDFKGPETIEIFFTIDFNKYILHLSIISHQ